VHDPITPKSKVKAVPHAGGLIGGSPLSAILCMLSFEQLLKWIKDESLGYPQRLPYSFILILPHKTFYFLNNVSRYLTETGISVDALLWQDELILVSSREKDLKEMFKITRKFSQNYGMKIDYASCAQAAFRHSKEDQHFLENIKLTMEGSDLPILNLQMCQKTDLLSCLQGKLASYQVEVMEVQKQPVSNLKKVTRKENTQTSRKSWDCNTVQLVVSIHRML
jgi:hypothetical protein